MARPVVEMRRGLRPHLSAATVFVLGIAVVLGATWAAWNAYEGNEDRLLDQQARIVSSFLTAALPGIELPLTNAAQLASVTGAENAQPLQDRLDNMLPPNGTFASVSVWRSAGGDFELVTSAGPPPELGTTAQLQERLRAAATNKGLTVVDLLDHAAGPRLGYAAATSYNGVQFVAYAESPLPEDRTTSRRERDDPFPDLSFAAYLGDHPDLDRLLVATTEDLPLQGRRATQTIPFGDTTLHVAISPAVPLSGSLLARLPWFILGGGSLAVLAAALTNEQLQRRRDHAEVLAEENARLYADQRSVATTLQDSLLPDDLPVVDGLDMAFRYEAGAAGVEVGGDWYDVVPIDDSKVLFVIGDVSGRGVRAAVVMGMLRHSIRAYALQGDPPETILSKLSALVSVTRDGHFATVLCGVVDLERAEVTIANAGHPPALAIDDGVASFLPTEVGVPVGLSLPSRTRPVTSPFPKGSTLVVFTDGLFERRGETVDDGLDRLRDVAASVPSDAALPDLLDHLMDGLAQVGNADDTAILALRPR